MVLALLNLLYRHKDPTRHWRADRTLLAVDLVRCTLCGVPVGGHFERLEPLGPSENARAATRGYPEWRSQGVYCINEGGLIGDFTVSLTPSRRFAAFPGRFLREGQPIDLSNRTTQVQLVALLGEPFGRSDNDWDDAVIFFYEYGAGEVQCAFDKQRGTLDAIEVWYEPELSQKGACEAYGIEKEFPDVYRRFLGG